MPVAPESPNAEVAAQPEETLAPEQEERVKPLELFFDLVFVLAFTQVTAMMSDDPTWEGLLRGMLVLAAVWWAWVGYAWLTNAINPEEGGVRLAFFAIMAAMLVVALAVPGAFDDDALVFGVAYLIVRVLHIVVYAQGSDDPDMMRSIRLLAQTAILGPSIILLASAFDGTTQGLLWAGALAIDFAGPYVRGVEGWQVSPGHFAERHGLIVIIALGESIVALGVGAGQTVDLGVIVAAVLGIALAAALWWSYFDVVAIVAEQRLRDAPDRVSQNRMARDSYSYIHLAMIAGIVLMALGIKKTLGEVDDPLKTVPAFALGGGVALYMLGHVAFRLRNVRSWTKRRPFVAALCLASIPISTELSAIAGLAFVTAVMCALIAFEVVAYHDARQRLRAAHAA